MKHSLLLYVVALSLSATPTMAKDKNPKDPTETSNRKEEANLINVIKQGNDYFFDVPNKLIGREMLCTVRFTATPGNTQKYGGEQTNEQTVYFEKADDKLMLRSSLYLNVS